MRVVKEAKERKNEILDAAAALFAQKGFDHTSTNDILEAVGIARGTLYHHFKSKEEIMDGIIERQSENMLAAARKIAGDCTISVEQRMLCVIMSLHLEDVQGGAGPDMIRQLHRPQNALMQQKFKKVILEQVPGILAMVIEDAVKQGLADTPYPLECMETAVAYLTTILDDQVVELNEQERVGRIQAFLFHLERMLGMKEGQLAYIGQMLARGDVHGTEE